MTGDASAEAAGDAVGGPIPSVPNVTICKVTPPMAEERQACRDAIESAIRAGAASCRGGECQARSAFFRRSNDAPVDPWRRSLGVVVSICGGKSIDSLPVNKDFTLTKRV